jgi:cell wall-associated NlpC family hydrolase
MPIARLLYRLICTAGLLIGSTHAAESSSLDDSLVKLLQDRGLTSQSSVVSRPRSRIEPANGRASELLVHAMGFLDRPYQWGGTSADTGFDCSGFVQTMYQEAIGLVLPRQAEKQALATEEISTSDLQPGDLVFFNTMKRAHSHVGIYVGDNKFIHSPTTGSRVRMEDMKDSYWKIRLDGLRRVSLSALLSMLE